MRIKIVFNSLQRLQQVGLLSTVIDAQCLSACVLWFSCSSNFCRNSTSEKTVPRWSRHAKLSIPQLRWHFKCRSCIQTTESHIYGISTIAFIEISIETTTL